MMVPSCPYASLGGERLVIKNTFIEAQEENDETTMTTSRRRVQSEPPMAKNRSSPSLDYRAGSHDGAERESKTLHIMTNMEDRITDAGSVTPRSTWSMSCPGTPCFPPQDAPQALQETAAASFISQPHTFQPHAIVRVEGTSRDECCIRWTADAKKVRGRDTTAVSPQFLLLGLPFKIVITPLVGSDSFAKAKGQGRMELKCLAQPNGRSHDDLPVFWMTVLGFPVLGIPMMTFRFSAGGGRGAEAVQSSKKLVKHNFAQTGLAKDPEVWDFNGLLDKTSDTFVVCLNVLSQNVLSQWH